MGNILKKVKNIFLRKSTTIEIEAQNPSMIYWTEKGTNYHTDKNCISLLRSKNIISGSLPDCPKVTLCEHCKNNQK